MDPLTVIGLAGNIVAFVDFAGKLIHGAHEVYISATGSTDENADLAIVIADLEAATRRLGYEAAGEATTDDDIALRGLVKQCRKLSDDLLRALQRLQAKDPSKKSKAESFQIAWRTLRQRGKLASLEKRVDLYRRQILDRIVIMMSEETSAVHERVNDLIRENQGSASQTRQCIQEMKDTLLKAIERLRLDMDANRDSSPMDTGVSGIAEVVASEQSLGPAACAPDPPASPPPSENASIAGIRDMLLRIIKTTQIIAKEDWILGKLAYPEMHHRELSIEDAYKETFRWLLYQKHDAGNDTSSGKGCIDNYESDDERDKQDNASGHDNYEPGSGIHQMPGSAIEGLKDAPGGSYSEGAEPVTTNDSKPVQQMQDSSISRSVSETSDVGKHHEEYPEIRNRIDEEMRQERTRHLFLMWLEAGGGIFHVTGKPGSGKSTLMKFLCGEMKTRESLKAWAGTKQLIFAQFFFWNSGTELQRSLEGLYRGILWEVLRGCPALMRDVFPRYWAQNSAFSSSSRLEKGPFQMSELLSAFELLVQNRSIFSTHRVCLFIDGLDEYDGDHYKLAHSLKAWSANDNLKICASSRPYNEFIYTFTDPERQFKLHELTAGDIRRFVKHEFEQDDRFARTCRKDRSYITLVEGMINRADGVFLWVTLATRELLEGIGNDYSVTQLQEDLNQLPAGLECLFRRMLESIRKSDRIRAARNFLLITNFGFSGQLAVVHAIMDELLDSSYDTADLTSSELGPPLTWRLLDGLIEKLRVRLNSRCKGLLHVSSDPALHVRPLIEGRLTAACVKVPHRSVHDFLAQPNIQEYLGAQPNDFEPNKLLSAIYLWLLRGCYGLFDTSGVPGLARPMFAIQWVVENLVSPLMAIAANAHFVSSPSYASEIEASRALLLRLQMHLSIPNTFQLETFMWLYVVKLSRTSLLPNAQALTDVWIALYNWHFCTLPPFQLSTKPSRDHCGREKRANSFLLATLGALYKSVLRGRYRSVFWTEAGLPRGIRDCEIYRRLEYLIEDDASIFSTEYKGLAFKRRSATLQEWPALTKRETVWEAFMLIITSQVFCIPTWNKYFHQQKDVACRLMELYLWHGADPTIIFIGDCLTTSALARTEEPHLFSFDLLQLIELWGPYNKPSLSELIMSKRRQAPWRFVYSGLVSILTRPISTYRIQTFDTETLKVVKPFRIVSVVSERDLARTNLSILNRRAKLMRRGRNIFQPYDDSWVLNI